MFTRGDIMLSGQHNNNIFLTQLKPYLSISDTDQLLHSNQVELKIFAQPGAFSKEFLEVPSPSSLKLSSRKFMRIIFKYNRYPRVNHAKKYSIHFKMHRNIFLPYAKRRVLFFPEFVRVSVCLSVCVSVSKITAEPID